MRIERAAVPIGRKDAPFPIKVPGLLRNIDRGATRQSHVTLIAEQALAGQMRGDQRGGTSGDHTEAGAFQVELVGDPRREILAFVVDPDRKG